MAGNLKPIPHKCTLSLFCYRLCIVAFLQRMVRELLIKGVEIMSSITCKSGASAIYDFASNLLKIYIYV
jgi:hypothetical protein